MLLRASNYMITHIHGRTLSIVYINKLSTILNLLEKYETVKIHIRNLQILISETFKVKSGIDVKIASDTF